MRGPRLIVVAVAAALATICATRRVALPQDASATVCRTIEGARDAGVERPLDWHELTDEHDRLAMAASCLLVEGAAIPRRMSPSPPTGARQDIVETARTRGLSVFYLPSMRNGSEEGAAGEDRGNAILSTLPLTELAGIELPFERQRRVAAAATVTRRDAAGAPWRLRVVSVHLNATRRVVQQPDCDRRSLWL
ncbi:MAG: hypothetical protein HOP16_10185 [Acidobacteria bacterium]|nr:hypothetical protein [Acidobacteriota bacterium]